MSKRLRGIDAQRRTFFFAADEYEFLRNLVAERHFLRELFMNLDVLQLDEELIRRVIPLGESIGKPLRPIRLNLNAKRFAPLDLDVRTRDVHQAMRLFLRRADARP